MTGADWIEMFKEALAKNDLRKMKVLLILAVELGYLTELDLDEIVAEGQGKLMQQSKEIH